MISHFKVRIEGGSFQLDATAPTIKLGERGVITGYLFSRQELGQRIDRFTDEQAAQIIETEGRTLITDYWGGYVAIISTKPNQVSVIRDPSGIMPCFWRQHEGSVVVANDIEDAACWGSPAKPDSARLAQYLASAGYHGDMTGLCDVSELLPGNRLIIENGQITISSLWSPWDYAHSPVQCLPAEAAAQLRETVDRCVGAWAGCFDNVVLGVSGGLNSSIVAASAAPHTQLRCLNMYADDADGDERRYAVILTEALGLKLDTGHFELEDIDVHKAIIPHRPWPNASYFALAIEARHEELERCRPVGAYFTGNGGDNIFCSIRSASPFLDRLFTEGPGVGLKRTLGDVCTLTETDIKTVLKTAWQQYLKTRKPAPIKLDLTGLRRDAIAPEAMQHPWRSAPTGELPGKLAHIGYLAGAQQSHELYPRHSHAPHIAPLLSQPIVELCLSIPSWLWIEGGRDRAIARQAFADILPDQLIRRSSKGGPGGFVQQIYRANADLIKSIIRNGKLVRNGYIDLGYVNAADDPTWRGSSRAQRLLQFAATENWIAYWEGRTTST